ncbi:LpqN/LpqT family lipoprotein [Mycolicibacterium mengxianglii]|nr:LpqN/LpqT family lipoprotein [Mycolicibacterium mengxianglii]
MKTFTSVAGAGVTALALGLALVGCGSDSSTEATSSSSTASSADGTSPAPAGESTAPVPTGPNKTIRDYITESGIKETAVRRGDPGPTVNLPLPPGWQQRDDLQGAPYAALVFPATRVPANPPRIVALMSKLTGDVDPQKLLEYAPNELQNMPGWQSGNGAVRNTLSGFDAVQIAGAYQVENKKGLIAQKTVVIPDGDDVYVLQINAYSDQSEGPILGDATALVDQQAKITL